MAERHSSAAVSPKKRSSSRRTGPANWAVLCGGLRSLMEASLVINDLIALRAEGLVQGIVLSTWEDDLGAHPDFRHTLEARSIRLITSPSMEHGGEGNCLRQHRLFLAGLRACPPDCAIFKVRTDKCIEILDAFRPALIRGPQPVDGDNLGSLPAIFGHRLVVRTIATTMPFNIEDIVFYGMRADIEQTINFDQYFDLVAQCGTMNAEIRYFCLPFLRRYPPFQLFFETVNCRRFSSAVIRAMRHDDPLPGLFIRTLALYALIVRSHFEFSADIPPISGEDTSPASPTTVSLKDVLSIGQETDALLFHPITHCDIVRAKTMAVFDSLLSGLAGGEIIAHAARRWREDGLGAYGSDLTPADYESLRAFLVAQGENPDKLLCPAPVSPQSGGPGPTGRRKDSAHDLPLDLTAEAIDDMPCSDDDRAMLVRMKELGGVEQTYFALGKRHLDDIGNPHAVASAMEWLERGAALRHNPSVLLLAKIAYDIGAHGRAFALFRDAAKRGDAEAQFLVAQMQLALPPHERDMVELKSMLRESSERGWQPAIAFVESLRGSPAPPPAPTPQASGAQPPEIPTTEMPQATEAQPDPSVEPQDDPASDEPMAQQDEEETTIRSADGP